MLKLNLDWLKNPTSKEEQLELKRVEEELRVLRRLAEERRKADLLSLKYKAEIDFRDDLHHNKKTGRRIR